MLENPGIDLWQQRAKPAACVMCSFHATAQSITLVGFPDTSLQPQEWSSAALPQERIASFQRTLDRCHSQAQSLEASIQAIWQGIFSARFRDVDADIRAAVICGIGDWITLHPADFLTDHYLKYVAWALSDRVRLPALTRPP